ncbi:putative ankyrin repeat protein RF_0381 [Cotesia glomerata]|uniref:putative ankyrin repeat protein RF_0381 n=1 Tax=Cotesia glomerata TaxID=32391 RepID=UPI001D0331DD|nr:putative ankyrin repeat protein RF_0381 [Cotesia glomerata]
MCALVCLPKPIAVSYSEISRHLELAVENGEIGKMEQLINSIADEFPVPTIFNGYSLLCKAIEYSQPEAAELLLNYIVNKENKAPLYTALHYAVLDNNLDITRLIAQRGANLNSKACIISDEINTETYTNRYATIFYRLSEKCSLASDKIIFRQCTPLHLAFKNESSEMIELLIFYGAKATAANLAENLPMDIAIKKNNIQAMKLLLNPENSQFILDKFEEPEYSHGYFQYISREIKAGILMQAISNKDSELAIKLIDSGVGVDADYRKIAFTLLIDAILCENLTVVKHLLRKGVEVNSMTKDGSTAMHYLFAKSFFDENGEDITVQVAELFLSHNVDFNLQDSRGMTPLHLVPYDVEKISFLLENGADINIAIDSGFTSFEETLLEIQEASDINRSWMYDDEYRACLRSVVEVFIKHIVKMISRNQPVSQNNLRGLEDHNSLVDFRDRCFSEAAVMRSVKAGQFFTLFNFWVWDDLDHLAQHVCNRDFIDFVTNSEKCDQRFPIYSADLKHKLNKCLTRKYLLNWKSNLIAKL